jgi:hypothetical protein
MLSNERERNPYRAWAIDNVLYPLFKVYTPWLIMGLIGAVGLIVHLVF